MSSLPFAKRIRWKHMAEITFLGEIYTEISRALTFIAYCSWLYNFLILNVEISKTAWDYSILKNLPSVGSHVRIGPILEKGFGKRVHVVQIPWWPKINQYNRLTQLNFISIFSQWNNVQTWRFVPYPSKREECDATVKRIWNNSIQFSYFIESIHDNYCTVPHRNL